MRIPVIIIFLLLSFASMAQTVPVPDTVQKPVFNKWKFARDSAYLARKKEVTDSVLANALINPAKATPGDPIVDSLLRANRHTGLNPLNLSAIFAGNKVKNPLKQGSYLPKGEVWSLGIIALFILLFSLLRYYFSRQLTTIVQSFFSNRVLGNLNKEDNLFTSWPFLLLFILFGFVVGMFYFLVTQFYQLAGGFRYFITISALIIVLYTGKILILKVLGQFFDIKRPVNEYVTILFLSYFNAGLLFLPLVIGFVLSPLKFGTYFITASYVILTIIIGLQFIRAGINILSNYRFPKLYLLLYFCALEICPIIILIKAIRY